jgi:hypothetical protein
MPYVTSAAMSRRAKTKETGTPARAKKEKHRTIEKRPTPVARSSPLIQTKATSNRTTSAA